MATSTPSVPLLLQRVPDARRAAVPVLPAVFLPYVALMLGAGAAGLCAFYNAVALRRGGQALLAIALGLAGWVAFGFVFVAVASSGPKAVALALLPARLLNIGFGVLLAWAQWAHVRGHEFLEGRTVPLVTGVVAAFVLALVIPREIRLPLEGLWPLLLR